ncbi:hypothetical protein [Miniphocaeibacter halophilus]|uniref:Uncharacterized protein n=1 Tax=Miniphocaeibacter halophilus TaxID=2931922 RepID=A0AC61MPU4_9FIRM|nr:hypothetical protein [Miniphocaeibacter halophilus]QQK07581.1 hypothetical protein JFY71_09830 [Miniphocaeibacter halophilus]
MELCIDKLLVELGIKIYDLEKKSESKKELNNLEVRKHLKEKYILLKLREIEIAQNLSVNKNIDVPNWLPYIDYIVKNEYICNDFLKSNTINNSKNLKKIFVNIKYLLYEDLYKDDKKFIKELYNKAELAYKNKNDKLLRLYEEISYDIFNKNISNGNISQDILENSIKKLEKENKEEDIRLNKIKENIYKNIDKLDKLIKEINDIFLMSIPEKEDTYIM